MDDRGKSAAPASYRCRRPEKMLWYRIVQMHLETWLVLTKSQFELPPLYAIQAFRRFLECGILAFGFARARYKECGHDFLVAFSCKGRGICPSCNTRRMVETAAHLVDHVFPTLPVRQWVLSVPKPVLSLTKGVYAIFCNAMRPCKAQSCKYSCAQ